MKFSALTVDFNSPSRDSQRSRKLAHESIKGTACLKCALSAARTTVAARDRYRHLEYASERMKIIMFNVNC